MESVKVLVVENEMIIADNICNTLEDLGYNVLEPAISYTEAMITIEKEKPDIAILDIILSGKKTGIDIAKQIIDNYHFPFVFLTSNSDSITLNKAKEVMPPAYLVKPFSKEELFTSIEIAISNYSKRVIEEEKSVSDKSIFIKNKGALLKVKFDDILYFKSSHVYVELFLVDNKKFLVRKSLNNIQETLNKNFVRVQRSFIVNIHHVKEVKIDSIIVDQEIIPIGKKYKEELIDRIKSI
ncbi:LytTR family transcriptional regulator DNA-binding domain-containing protein [Polaribacter vadi]|uniref:LytR/AlgR family response regulator transcription factor n=1 Tax=Polaribacter TaxID=52959 RepID=UPI001C088BF6|nr:MULTISPECIES: LytTR family transcriptional regulator DNA-binding domain-containing protein [Polaribacter]MBU3011004.1 LytTR family transcriptional regulator DNA-binding domain-containing protein [Polaribacter vadi]MDO6740818.1 LytTR family transcriptional regulator DNA-binding domain-containing protein [Polaribacter sp. 1_MG-2023]